MKKTILKVLCVLLAVLPLFSLTVSATPGMNLVIEDGESIKTPLCYSCTQVISTLGEKGGTFREATDFFLDDGDNIYIADEKNNRIILLDPAGNYLRDYTGGGKLNGPKSVFVSEDGDLFVSDTGNQQIVHLDRNDRQIECFTRPESELLDGITDFSVNRLAVSKQGLIYLIYAQQFMMIDAKNEFKGFVGANKVSFNLKEFFVRTFGSEVQKNKMVTQQAATYNAFAIGEDGLVYAVANDKQNQLRILNVDGDNLFPAGVYGVKTMEDKSTNTFGPSFVDICVDNSGIIHALEKYSCQVYSYTSKGEMVAVYGGIGNIRGKFTNPVAVDINSAGEVFVLDASNGTLHRFTPTEYVNSILEAYRLFEDGRYADSMKKWESVLDINVNCSLANSAMGKICFKQEKYRQAMTYYKNADNKSGYAAAFSEFRHEIFRNYFGWIVAALVVLIVGIWLLIKLLFRRGKRTVDQYYSGGARK